MNFPLSKKLRSSLDKTRRVHCEVRTVQVHATCMHYLYIPARSYYMYTCTPIFNELLFRKRVGSYSWLASIMRVLPACTIEILHLGVQDIRPTFTRLIFLLRRLFTRWGSVDRSRFTADVKYYGQDSLLQYRNRVKIHFGRKIIRQRFTTLSFCRFQDSTPSRRRMLGDP